MRNWTVGLVSLTLAAGTVLFATGPAAAVPAQPGESTGFSGSAPSDDLPDALEGKRREAREVALNMVLNGQAKVEKRGASSVVNIGAKRKAGTNARSAAAAGDQYVELAREKTDKIFVILAEFGNVRHPSYPDQDTSGATPGPITWEGPLVNQIPQPNRAVDNTTVWQPDYNRAHFEQMYFGQGAGVESLKTYYERQSSGRYSVDGMVTDWVKVPYNEARYGRSNGFPCGSNVCSNTWFLIRDAIDMWVASQRAQGRTDEQIRVDLASFDVWDRFDFDGDGNFNEPDGYIDHFQIVHAGGDQADGDPIYGEDAIWSHRWAAFQTTTTGPPNNLRGGVQVGTTGLWVRDYTIQPENGGLGVFAHEYGHDLGLPDEYDTSGAGGNQENPVSWWTLMAQSRVDGAGDQGLGTRAADLGPWDKLQLGWFDYEIVVAGQNKTLNLGPHEYNTSLAQGFVVVLPKKEIVTPLRPAPEGTKSWYSGSGNNLDSSMTRTVDVPVGNTTLSFQAAWDIEDCGPDACDYAYVEVDDGSGTFTPIAGSITNAAEGNGIDGTTAGFVPATFDLSAYAGKSIQLRFRYLTDPAAAGNDPEVADGIFIDDIRITSNDGVVFSDGAESGANGWTLTGFSAVGATLSTLYDNYYIGSYRAYVSFDQYLRTGPYNFGFTPDRPDLVERFPYQDGLLLWYWDTSFGDNNTSVHPGGGLILPVDAHPDLVYRLDGQPWRPRVQGYDATFTPQKADSFSLHFNNASSYIRGQAGVAQFDDARSYYREDLAAGIRYGVKVPNNGVQIRVLTHGATTMRVRIS